MTDYTLIPLPESTSPADTLATHLINLPKDEATTNLIAALYERYSAKGCPNRFALRPFDARIDVHGLLVGYTDSTVVFWRSSCGHFWLQRTEVSFQHGAAFLPGTTAPFIESPRVSNPYRFIMGYARVVAEPWCSTANLLESYREHMRANATKQSKNVKKDGSGDDGSSSALVFHPEDNNFSMLGIGKS
jgi:hypothetical protein